MKLTRIQYPYPYTPPSGWIRILRLPAGNIYSALRLDPYTPPLVSSEAREDSLIPPPKGGSVYSASRGWLRILRLQKLAPYTPPPEGGSVYSATRWWLRILRLQSVAPYTTPPELAPYTPPPERLCVAALEAG